MPEISCGDYVSPAAQRAALAIVRAQEDLDAHIPVGMDEYTQASLFPYVLAGNLEIRQGKYFLTSQGKNLLLRERGKIQS
jgi:hypothetical protein